MNIFIKAKNSVVNVVKTVRDHWTVPAKGEFVPYKEIAAYGIGSIGHQFVCLVLGLFTMGTGSILMFNTLKLQPMHMQYIGTILTILGAGVAILRNYILENSPKTRFGKFRPYILFMGVPLVALATTFIFLDFDKMPYMTKLIYASVFCFLTASLMPFYSDSYNFLKHVISPDSAERSKIGAIIAIFHSLAPSIYYALMPLILNFVGFTMYEMRAFRYVILPFAFVGILLSLPLVFGTKERMVVSKAYTPKVNLGKSIMEIYRNKYWIILKLSEILGFLEAAIGMFFFWIFVYDNQNMAIYAAAQTVLGTAATIAIVLTPVMIRKLGTRATKLIKEGGNVVLLALMAFCLNNIYLFMIIIYVNMVFQQLTVVLFPVMEAEIKDYQQFISGRRLDATQGTAALILMPITILTGYALPFAYEALGLTKNPDVMFDPMIRNTMFGILCVLGVIGALLNFLPLLFYDLTREKHRNIVKVLRIRALFEDYANNALSSETIKRGVEEHLEAAEWDAKEEIPVLPLKQALKEARKLPFSSKEAFSARRAAVKAARKELRAALSHNDKKKNAKIVIDEMNKFSTPENIWLIEQAHVITDGGLENLAAAGREFSEAVRLLPEANKKEIAFKKKQQRRLKKILAMPEKIAKKYPQGLEVPDPQEINVAINLPDETKEQRKHKGVAVKAAERTLSKYNRVVGEYVHAQKLLITAESYTHYAEIEALYEESCADIDERHRIAKEKADALKAEKKAEQERIRTERKEKKEERRKK